MAQPHPEPEPTTARTGVTVLGRAREARDWLQRLGEVGIALQLVVVGIALVWFTRRVIDVRSTAFLLVVLLLPAAVYLALRRPETVAGRDWFSPLRAFRTWLASLGEIGRVIELGLLSMALMWFTNAIVGVDSVPLYALELVTPQLVFLILTGRSRE